MRIAVKPNLRSKTFSVSKSYTLLKEKEICSIDFKFYQKLFTVLISMTTILIFSEAPRELENICVSYNSRKSCMVW